MSEPRARYRVTGELGAGATGRVQLAFDEIQGRNVAIKRMHRVGSEALFRLKQEFRAARDLSHPNLVRLYDLVVDDHETFFTMEPILGVDVTAFAAACAGRGRTTDPETLAQLCAALSQLVRAVQAVHDAGLIHRDIKPPNVLVEEGTRRVVLLDFGFASALPDNVAQSEDREVVGTLPYLAPECLWGSPPTAASDWYSVGALMAELFLGRPPFSGSIQQLLRDKDRPLTTLRAEVPKLPAALDDIIVRLLARDPGARPSAADVARAVGKPVGSTSASAPAPMPAAFVGRRSELATMTRALGRHKTTGGLLRVVGPSGMGKTAIVERLLGSLPRETLIFSGRCHPREHVRFSALDEVMDQLSRHLRRLPEAQRSAIVPQEAGVLSSLFPVLSRVPGLDQSAANQPADPLERRQAAVAALGQLWSALAARAAVVIWVDDLQWADGDCMQLLGELTTTDRPAAISWIFSHRPGSAADGAGQPTPAALALPEEVLALGAMPDEDARVLALALGTPAESLATVVTESRGYPFFLTELARYLRDAGEGPRPKSLAAIIQARTAHLSTPTRRLLESLCLASSALSADLCRSLIPNGGGVDALESLERSGLIRLDPGPDRSPAYEPSHDRIREEIAAALPPAAVQGHHAALAQALAVRPGTTAATLAYHYRAAADTEQAVRFTRIAAEDASNALAFDEAARSLQILLDLHPAPAPWHLRRDLADALVNAGQCGQAAVVYQQAAEAATQQNEPARTLALLRRRAGEQHLYAGHIGEGHQILREVLHEHGVRIPARPVLASLLRRLRFALRRPRPATDPNAADRGDYLDALWYTAKGTVMVEHVLGDSLALQSLLEALRGGDLNRIIPPLGHEAVSEANIGGRMFRNRSFALLEETARLVALAPTPYNRGWLQLCRGAAAYFSGRWRTATDELIAAADTFRVGCVGAVYDYAVANVFLVCALGAQGRYAELGALLPALMRWARERGNVYAEAMFAYGGVIPFHIAKDQPDEAIAEADRVLAAWKAPGFTSPHYYHFSANATALLYKGQVWQAWRLVVDTWPSLRKQHFLDIELIGTQLRDLRARAALMAAQASATQSAPPDLRSWTRKRLIEQAVKEAARIRRSELPHAAPTVAVLHAGIAVAQNKLTLARRELDAAAHGFEAAGMPQMRDLIEMRLGALADDQSRGARRGADARTALTARGVVDPDRLMALVAACLPCLPSQSLAAASPGNPAASRDPGGP